LTFALQAYCLHCFGSKVVTIYNLISWISQSSTIYLGGLSISMQPTHQGYTANQSESELDKVVLSPSSLTSHHTNLATQQL